MKRNKHIMKNTRLHVMKKTNPHWQVKRIFCQLPFSSEALVLLLRLEEFVERLSPME